MTDAKAKSNGGSFKRRGATVNDIRVFGASGLDSSCGSFMVVHDMGSHDEGEPEDDEVIEIDEKVSLQATRSPNRDFGPVIAR